MNQSKRTTAKEIQRNKRTQSFSQQIRKGTIIKEDEQIRVRYMREQRCLKYKNNKIENKKKTLKDLY